METVTAHAPLLEHLVRDGIHISLLRHCLVESSIEHCYLWNIWHELLHSHDALEVGWVVERAEHRALLDNVDELVGHKARLGNLHCAMEHAVTHSLNLVGRLQHAILWIEKVLREHELNGSSMLKHEMLDNDLVTLVVGELEE